ncbi:MAG: hypothetical protein CMJ64_24295 [Planctomycetaceae bacterium]|nr:hypothetical protein [Planctomycetaceae bacterium]
MPTRQGRRDLKQRTGHVPKGFNITDRVRAICADISQHVPELAHIDVNRIGFAFAQTRKAVMHGMQASLTPLRFEDGSLTGEYRGRPMRVQRVFDNDGREMLYIYTVYLPRFTNLDFREKLITIFHELWHISPEFNGDLRRHSGRCYAHSHSQSEYDAHMAVLADRWLKLQPPEELFEFLRLDFAAIEQRYGRVFGMRIARPRLLPIS